MQIESILEKVNTLIKALTPKEDKYKDNLLEIEKVENYKKYQLLQRTSESIKQYINKENELQYIGLLGHFSTGKSSTINSILNAANFRKTDLQPTVSAITLITHGDNKQSLENIESTNKYISIRTQFINNDILKNIVLIDTPGVGDPHIINEMVKDFLPICDLILYFFQATNALDNADMPILEQKQQELPYVPIKFIVTRADEFRADDNKPLDNDNFNTKSFANFQESLLNRLKDLIKDFELKKNDIYIIDNKANYGIDKLKDYLLNIHDNITHDTIIKMNNHKIMYFSTKSEKIQNFFYTIISNKLNSLEQLYETLEDNIINYTKQVDITHYDMNKQWNKINEKLNETIIRINKADIKNHINFMDDIWQIEEIKQVKIGIIEYIDQLSSDLAIKIKQDLSPNINEPYHETQNIKTKLLDLKFDTLSEVNIKNIFSKHISIELDTNIKIPQDDLINSKIAKLNNILYKVLKNNKDEIITNFNSLRSRTDQNNYISKELDDILNEAFNNLTSDMNNYFYKVDLFKVATVAMGSHITISNLDISEELNDKQMPFDDDKKNTLIIKARNKLFDSYDIYKSEHANTLKVMNRDIQIKINELKAYDISLINNIDHINLQTNMEDSYLNSVKEKISTNKKSIQNYREEIITMVRGIKKDYQDSLDSMKYKKYKKYLLIVGLPSIVIFVSLFIGNSYYAYIKIMNSFMSDNTIISNIVYTLISTLILSLLTYGYEEIKNMKLGSPKQKEEKIKLKEIKEKIDNILSMDKTDIEQDKLAQSISSLLKEKLNELKINNIFIEFKGKYNLLSNNYNVNNEYIDKYKEIHLHFINKLQPYFNDANSNLAKLKEISDNIKEDTMMPFVEGFDKFKKRANDINDKIIEINFT